MTIIIGLHGKAHAGKDTVGRMLIGYGLDRVAFADPIKRMLIEGLGLTAEHFDSPLKEEVIPWLGKSPRQLMQTLGTEWGRDLVNRDLWILIAARDIAASRMMGRGTVVTDVRKRNEAEYIRRAGGQIWHIIRHTDPVAAHSSEQGLDRALIDRTIDNTGTLDHTRRQVADAYAMAVLDLDPLDCMESGA